MERQIHLTIEIDREEDGRWIAAVRELPGAVVYGQTPEEAVGRVKVLTFQIFTDRLEHGEDLLTGHKPDREVPAHSAATLGGIDFRTPALAV